MNPGVYVCIPCMTLATERVPEEEDDDEGIILYFFQYYVFIYTKSVLLQLVIIHNYLNKLLDWKFKDILQLLIYLY